MSALSLLAPLVSPLLRRVEFRGKGRIRGWLDVPDAGAATVRFAGGLRLQLDLSQSLHRDYYCGLIDLFELRLMRAVLAGGGDMVDVGAHIGVYSAAAALATSGRIAALEPNPAGRGLLDANLALNHVTDRVTVIQKAAGAREGVTSLYAPLHGDSAWATLTAGRLDDTAANTVEVTTVDAIVAELQLEPAFVKIDVEGTELEVISGMRETLARRPFVLCEVSVDTAEVARSLLPEGYELLRVASRRLVEGFPAGICNALAIPRERVRTISGFRIAPRR